MPAHPKNSMIHWPVFFVDRRIILNSEVHGEGEQVNCVQTNDDDSTFTSQSLSLTRCD